MADPVTEFEAYRDELLERLGDGDPLERLAATPGDLAERLAGLDEPTAAQRPGEGAWSVKEVVGHLGDTEWVYGYRMRMMLTHDRPGIPGYDQDTMVAGLDHNARALEELLDEQRRLREWNVALYRRSRGPAWERVGMHAERGPESVDLSIRLLAGHDLRHLDQIDRTLKIVAEG
jgi:hypothetical protein